MHYRKYVYGTFLRLDNFAIYNRMDPSLKSYSRYALPTCLVENECWNRAGFPKITSVFQAQR